MLFFPQEQEWPGNFSPYASQPQENIRLLPRYTNPRLIPTNRSFLDSRMQHRESPRQPPEGACHVRLPYSCLQYRRIRASSYGSHPPGSLFRAPCRRTYSSCRPFDTLSPSPRTCTNGTVSGSNGSRNETKPLPQWLLGETASLQKWHIPIKA